MVVQKLVKNFKSHIHQRTVRDFVAALKQCTKTRNLEGGKVLHSEAVAAGYHKEKYVASALITMYRKCSSVLLAREVFDGMVEKDVVTWTSLILGYVENGERLTALELFACMDCKPTYITYLAALKACGGLAAEKELPREVCIQKGIAIHKQVKECGFDSEIAVGNTLVDMYGKCGCLQLAQEVFDKMVHKNVVTWTCLILGYVKRGECTVAMELFSRMDCKPDSLTYVALLKACAGLASEKRSEKQLCLEKGIAIHERIKEHGFDSEKLVADTLVEMYSKCGSMPLARQVFERMSHKDAVTWTCLILGYVENGESLIALDLFTRMNCEPTHVTYLAALKACASLASERDSNKLVCLQKGKAIHEQVKKHGFESNLSVANTLVDMYGKCGSMSLAQDVFQRMIRKDVVTWTCMILGYVRSGEYSLSMDLFLSMDCAPTDATYIAVLKACASLASEKESHKQVCLERGMFIHEQVKKRRFDCDLVVASTLVDMYSKCGKMLLAREVFEGMIHKDVVTWNCLILGYVKCGEYELAMDLIKNIDCELTDFTYVAALKACGGLNDVLTGQAIHARVCELGLEDQVLATALIGFYGKCGRMNTAVYVLRSMHSPDIESWSSLLAGYSSLGDAFQVFSLAREIHKSGLQMDGVIFICILRTCSVAGMVEEGITYFKSMLRHGISPTLEHYTCMVDMLGRANRLDEALSLVNSMPYKADIVTWTSLLGACRKWQDLHVGKVAFDALVSAEDEDAAAACILMRNMYIC